MKPLDEYISFDDGHFKWHEDKDLKFTTALGGTAHVLNVTSQKWLDESYAKGPTGAVWTHQVIVIIPVNFDANAKTQVRNANAES